MGERILPVTFILALGIIANAERTRGNWPPRPHTLVGVALVFTVLAVVAVVNPGLAAAFGAAVDVGLVVRPQVLTGSTSSPGTAAPTGPTSGGQATGPVA